MGSLTLAALSPRERVRQYEVEISHSNYENSRHLIGTADTVHKGFGLKDHCIYFIWFHNMIMVPVRISERQDGEHPNKQEKTNLRLEKTPFWGFSKLTLLLVGA